MVSLEREVVFLKNRHGADILIGDPLWAERPKALGLAGGIASRRMSRSGLFGSGDQSYVGRAGMELKGVTPHAAKEKAFSLLGEFRSFAFKGNVVDLAIGVIIGAAFGKLIDSLVKNVLMPLIGLLLPGEQGYLGWKWVVEGKEVPFGLFLGEMVNFLVVSFALFVFAVKFLGWIARTRKEEAVAPPPTKDQVLLTEIRDLLKEKQPPPQTTA